MPKTSTTSFGRNPELELVLCCTRPSMDLEITNRANEIINLGIEWAKVIEIAASSRVTPLFYRNLKSISRGEIPDSVIEQLKKKYTINLQENFHLIRELQLILRLLEKNDIPSLCYKGPTFAIWLYGDLSLRHWGDLDILVHKSDVVKAKEVLLSNGFTFIWPKFPLNRDQEAAHLESKYNYTFVNESTGVVLELHWGITPKYFSFPPETEWLWKQLVRQDIAGMEVLTFTPEDYLLILSVHGSIHGWMRISWICDIAELIDKHPNLNWEYIIREAQSFGVRRILLLGLFIAHEFLGTNLNEDVTQLINADPQVRILEKQIASKYLENDYIGTKAFEIPLFHLRVRERFSDKVRYCSSMGNSSSKDWVIFQNIQPNSVIFLVLRPLRLIIEHGLVPITKRLKNRITN